MDLVPHGDFWRDPKKRGFIFQLSANDSPRSRSLDCNGLRAAASRAFFSSIFLAFIRNSSAQPVGCHSLALLLLALSRGTSSPRAGLPPPLGISLLCASSTPWGKLSLLLTESTDNAIRFYTSLKKLYTPPPLSQENYSMFYSLPTTCKYFLQTYLLCFCCIYFTLFISNLSLSFLLYSFLFPIFPFVFTFISPEWHRLIFFLIKDNLWQN
jgi:hypothetical protein